MDKGAQRDVLSTHRTDNGPRRRAQRPTTADLNAIGINVRQVPAEKASAK